MAAAAANRAQAATTVKRIAASGLMELSVLSPMIASYSGFLLPS